MGEIDFLTEILKSVGFPAVIFIIWYLYHKSHVEFLKQILSAQAEREEKLTEALQALVAITSRMEFKIDRGYVCPVIKEQK